MRHSRTISEYARAGAILSGLLGKTDRRVSDRRRDEHTPEPTTVPLLEALDVGVIVVDGGRRELYRNPAAGQLLREDSEAPSLLAAAEALAADAIRVCGLPGSERLSAHQRTRRAQLRTSSGCYSLAAATATFGPASAIGVLITIVPMSPRCIMPASLCARYGFTPREAEVAVLLARGDRNVEVARQLGVSAHTARHHTERVLTKLGVRSRACVARVLDAWERGP